MNKPLFLSTLKSRYILILLISAFLLMYSVIIISMFDPGDAESSQTLLETMPEDFNKAFSFEIIQPTLAGLLAGIMYSLPYMIFMIAYTLIIANSLIARIVERGSIACYLATPVSRTRVVISRASVLILGEVVIVFLLTLVSILAARGMHGSGTLDIRLFILVNCMGFCLFLLVGAYSFLFSCIFNEEKYSLLCSAGLTFLLYIINTIGNINDELSTLKKISPFGYFQPTDIVKGDFEILLPAVLFILISTVIYTLSMVIFNKRDLSL